MMKNSEGIREEHPEVCVFRNRRFGRLIEDCLKKARHSTDAKKSKFKAFAKFSKNELRAVIKDVAQQYIFKSLSRRELEGDVYCSNDGFDHVICHLGDEEQTTILAELLESNKGKVSCGEGRK
jgi:hypothetical protein